MTKLLKCGICVVNDETDNCFNCGVGICGKCRYTANIICGSLIPRQRLFTICKLCDILCADPYNICLFRYCHKCDNLIQHNYNTRHKCHQCKSKNRRMSRSLLPHYKAKPIIDEILHIKDVSQIIFDYYYKPRRYFESEF